MKNTILAAALLAAVAPAAHAQFEGVVEMKMTGPRGSSGTMTSLVGRPGARMEMNMSLGAEGAKAGMSSMKMVMLMKYANPDVLYAINDERHAYSEMNVKEMAARAREMEGSRDPETFTVKKIGSDRVAGYACQNAHVTGSRGTDAEMCIATDILGLTQFAAKMNRGRNQDGLFKALKDQGLDGYPVRMIMKERGEQVRWELVRAERKSLPGSTFEIPAGYQKDESLGGMGAALPAGAAKAMEDALKNMTPEQRRQFEEMMKKAGQKAQ